MATFNPNTLKAGAVGMTRLQENAKKGVELPSRREVVEAGAETYFDITRPEVLSNVARTTDTVAGLAWMGTDMILPAVVAGSAGAMKYAGKGIGAMGAVGTAGSLQATSNIISDKYKAFTETPISSMKSGEKLAFAVNGVVNPFYRATAAINKRTGLFSGLAERAQGKALAHAGKAESLAASIAHIPADLSQAIQGLLSVKYGDVDGLENAGKIVQDWLGEKGRTLGKTEKSVRQIVKLNEKAHIAAGKATDWHVLATGEHNTLEAVKNASLQRGVSGGLLSVASTASVVATTMDTVSDVKAFRQLVADLKGKDAADVNSGDALFSELPYGGQVARRALFMNAGPRGVLEAINTVFNVKMIKGSHMSMLMFMLPMGLSQAVGMLTSGNVLDVYKEMKKNEAAGKANLPDQYAQLIGMTHKELHQRGGGSSNFAQEIGRIYADRHASVKETLQAVMNGQVDKELQAIVAHNAEPEKVATEKSGNVPSAEVQQVTAVQPNAAQSVVRENSNTLLANMPTSFAERLMAEHQHAPEAAR